MEESGGGGRHEAGAAARLRRRLRRAGLAALVVAAGAAAAGILGRYRHETEVRRWTAASAVPTVSVVSPRPGPSSTSLTLPGNVAAWYEAPIYARVNGYLKAWYFDYGAPVKQGDLLAEIEAPDLDAQLAASQAKLNSARSVVKVRQAEVEFAQTTYERWRDSPRGVVSVQERENKKANYRTAVAQLNAAIADVAADQGEVDRLQALEGFKRIVAPFDGIVTARETDVGALINAGSAPRQELFRVADVHEMRVFVRVPQRQSVGVVPGLTAELDLPQYPGRHFTAVVATTAQAIATASRTLLVELHAANPHGLL